MNSKVKLTQMGLLVGLMIFGITGCWDSNEIDQLAIVTTSGVDIKQANSESPIYTVSLQIARTSQLGTSPSGGSSSSTGSKDTFVTLERDGSDILTSLDKLQSQIARKAIRTHRLAVVVGESFAKYGLSPVLDEIVRHPGSRLRAHLFVSYHGKASTILNLPYAFSRLPSEAIDNLHSQGLLYHSTTKDFVQELNGKSDPWLPGIEPVETNSSKEPNTFNLSHIALFQNDKMVGWLDGEDVKGFNWLTNQVRGSIISVHVPGHVGTVNGESITSKSKMRVRLVNGKPVIQIRINAEEETVATSTNLNMRDPENIKLVEAAFADYIKNQSESALTKIKQSKSDVLGIGELIYQRYPKVWHQMEPHWRDEFSRMPVDVQVRVKVMNSGSSGPSITKQEIW